MLTELPWLTEEVGIRKSRRISCIACSKGSNEEVTVMKRVWKKLFFSSAVHADRLYSGILGASWWALCLRTPDMTCVTNKRTCGTRVVTYVWTIAASKHKSLSTNNEVSALLSEMYERVAAVNRLVRPSTRQSPAEWTRNRSSQTFSVLPFQQLSQSAWQMASHSVSHASKQLIRQSAKLSDRKPTSQELVRHYVCQPIKQQATVSDHQPGSVTVLGYMHKSSKCFSERVLFVNN